MEKPLFDASSFVKIDLTKGAISSSGKDRLVMVPISVLQSLRPSDTLRTAAMDWGKLHGRRLAERVDQTAENTSLEALSSHLGGTLAAFGLGRLSIEIHGSALLFKAEGDLNSRITDGVSVLMEGFLAGYLSALGSDTFKVVRLGEASGGWLFWAGNPRVAPKIRQRVSAGRTPMEILNTLVTGEN